jgi:hypothetical protein
MLTNPNSRYSKFDISFWIKKKATDGIPVIKRGWKIPFCSHQSSWDLGMFIPLKMLLVMVFIGIDP